MPSAGPTQDCMSADDKQTPHLGIAPLADPTELLPTSGREFPWDKADPSREVSAGSKLGGVRDRGRDQRGCDRADAGNCCEAAADLVGAVPGNQPIVEMVDPLVEIADLSNHHRGYFLEKLRDLGRISVRHQGLEESYVPRSFRSDKSELPQIATESLDQLCALAHENIS